MSDRQAALPTWDTTGHRILDAADELMLRRGTARLTLAEIARKAGLSRQTVYRTWQGGQDVVHGAMLRRIVRLIEDFPTLPATRQELVDAVMQFTERFRSDELFSALLRDEPEAFAGYLLLRTGSSQHLMQDWLAAAIAGAQAGGTVRGDDPREMAVVLLLVTQSAVASRGTVSGQVDEAAFARELRTAVEGMLKP